MFDAVGVHINSSGGGSSTHRRDDPEATFVRSPSGRLTCKEGKVAQKFIDGINVMTFDAHLFANAVLTMAGDVLEERVFQIVRSIVDILAMEYDYGKVTNVTVAAKRMQDGLSMYAPKSRRRK